MVRRICFSKIEMEFDEDVFQYFTDEEAFEFSLIMEWATHGNYQETILNRCSKQIYEWVLKVAKRLIREGWI